MRLISWNVNGLRACVKKGFGEAFGTLDADAFCLQETKLSQGQLELPMPGYTQLWSYAEKKGYSGTAIFLKKEPLSVRYGMGIPEHDHEGRVIAAELEDMWLVDVYVPNSKDGLLRLDYRMTWEDDFRAFLAGLARSKPVVVCGDMNVAHCEIDIKNPDTNHQSAGFTDAERGKMTELLASGFIDTFRLLWPDKRDAYSWWSYRAAARARNVGWRIDYFLVSRELHDRVTGAFICPEIEGSDHCPVGLELL